MFSLFCSCTGPALASRSSLSLSICLPLQITYLVTVGIPRELYVPLSVSIGCAIRYDLDAYYQIFELRIARLA